MFWSKRENRQNETQGRFQGLRKVLPFIAAALIGSSMAVTALAAEAPDLSRTDGRITLDLNYVDANDNTAKVLQDGTATIYKVAGFSDDRTFDINQGVFADLAGTVTELASLNTYTSEQLDEINDSLAATLYASASGQAGTSREITTDDNGSADFGGLSTGLYLVTFAPGESQTAFNPFLVSVPYYDEDTGEYTFRVDAKPKYDIVPGGQTEPNEDETSFDFRKVWTKDNKKVAWESQPGIRIRIRRYIQNGDQETTDYITIGKDTTSEDVETPFKAVITRVSTANNVYGYTVTGLEKYKDGDTSNPWIYQITEAKVTGHEKPKYYRITKENGQETATEFTYDAEAVFVPMNDKSVLQIENPASETPEKESEPPRGGGGNNTPGGGSSGGGTLPQTGQLWWPVPILVLAGIVLVLAGFVMRRKSVKGH